MTNFCVEGKTGQFSVSGKIAGTYEVAHVYKDEIKDEPAAVVRLSYNEEHQQRGLLDNYSLFNDDGTSKTSFVVRLLPDKKVLYAVVNRDTPISLYFSWTFSTLLYSRAVEYASTLKNPTKILKITVEEV